MKIKSILCGALAVLMVSTLSTAAFADSVLYGDATQDGKVNASDLTRLARHVGNIETLTGKGLTACILSGGTTAGSSDLTKLARFIAKISGELVPEASGLTLVDTDPNDNSGMVISFNDLL